MRAEEYTAMYEVEDAHWWYTGMRHVADGLLAHRFGDRLGQLDVLDAGCGTGGNSAHLQRYGRVVGLDVSAMALHLARQRPGLRLLQGSVEQLPLRDAQFDLVVSNDVLCHLQVADDAHAVAEFVRMLRPDGVLYLQLPAFERLRSHHDIAVHTTHRYTRQEVGQLLHRAGLRVRRVTYANALLFPAAAAWRLAHQGVAADKVSASDVQPVARPINTALRTLLRVEARIIQRRNLPAGLSVVGVATKDR